LPAGYFRGRLEAGVVGATDIVLAFPGIILALLVAAYAGASLTNLVLVLGFLGIPGYTRIARATTLNCAQRDFVTAARAIGGSHLRIMMRELLPNLVPPISAIVVLGMSRIIVIEGTLSFLGLSLPPPAPYLGEHDRGWCQRARLPPGHQLCPCWRHVHHYPRAECLW
jgi:peptide/nickel transport system permease protein